MARTGFTPPGCFAKYWCWRETYMYQISVNKITVNNNSAEKKTSYVANITRWVFKRVWQRHFFSLEAQLLKIKFGRDAASIIIAMVTSVAWKPHEDQTQQSNITNTMVKYGKIKGCLWSKILLSNLAGKLRPPQKLCELCLQCDRKNNKIIIHSWKCKYLSRDLE